MTALSGFRIKTKVGIYILTDDMTFAGEWKWVAIFVFPAS